MTERESDGRVPYTRHEARDCNTCKHHHQGAAVDSPRCKVCIRTTRLRLWEGFPVNDTPLPTAELTGAFTPVREMLADKPRIPAKEFYSFFQQVETVPAGFVRVHRCSLGLAFGNKSDCTFCAPFSQSYAGVAKQACGKLAEQIVETTKPAVTADALLTEAAVTLKARGKERDTEDGERSMARCVDAFNCFTDRDLSEEEGWLFMQCLKQSRMRGGGFKADDYMDSIGYASLQAETAIREHTQHEASPS